MATAIGAYATLAAAKAYLGIADSGDDTLLSAICDRVNQWIERTTGRVLAPMPNFSTTVASGATLGATTVTLASVTGLNVGDEIMFAAVTATPHESTDVLAINGSVVTLKTPLGAAYSNGTAVARVIVQDGSDALEDGHLMLFPRGIVTLGALEIAFYTGGAFNLVPSSDWKLRPSGPDLSPGFPFTELWLVDIPSAGNPTPVIFPGFDTVRLSGMTTGWPAMPDDIVDFANRLVVNIWKTRGAAGGDQVSVGADGSHTITRLMSATDWSLIRYYSIKSVGIV